METFYQQQFEFAEALRVARKELLQPTPQLGSIDDPIRQLVFLNYLPWQDGYLILYQATTMEAATQDEALWFGIVELAKLAGEWRCVGTRARGRKSANPRHPLQMGMTEVHEKSKYGKTRYTCLHGFVNEGWITQLSCVIEDGHTIIVPVLNSTFMVVADWKDKRGFPDRMPQQIDILDDSGQSRLTLG